MTPDLEYWGRLGGWLAAEAAVLPTIAWVLVRRCDRARRRRAVWQAALLGTGLLWLGELAGTRLLFDAVRPAMRVESRFDVQVTEAQAGPATTVWERPAATRPAASGGVGWWPAALWFGGSLLCLTGSALAQAALWRGHRRSIPADPDTRATVSRLSRDLGLGAVEVRLWPGLRGPLAYGLWRPRIAWPADHADRFGPDHREAVLAHELGHVAAGDAWWLAVTQVIGALAWWHPGVWWARRRMRVEMEAVADEASAVVPGGREALAEALVAFGRDLIAPVPRRGLGMAGAGLRSELAGRVTQLLAPAGGWQPPSRRQAWFPVAIALGVAVLGLGSGVPAAPVEPLGGFLLDGIRGLATGARVVPPAPVPLGVAEPRPKVEVAPVPNPPEELGAAPLDRSRPEAAPAPEGIIHELRPATDRAEDLARVEPTHPGPGAVAAEPGTERREAGVGANPPEDSGPTVTLRIRFYEVPDPREEAGGRGPSGVTAREIDRLFGPLPDTETPVFTEVPTGDLPGASSSRAASIRMDRSRTERQVVVLGSGPRLDLERRLANEAAVKSVAAPAVTTVSGRVARVQVSEVRSVVTGVDLRDGSVTNPPFVNYFVDPIALGPWVEVRPVWVDGAWEIGVTARWSEFVGYDDPGAVVVSVSAADGRAAPLAAQLPLPHLRVREATGVERLASPDGRLLRDRLFSGANAGNTGRSSSGEGILLRGPAAETTERIRRGWLRAPRLETVRRRLYVLVTPEAVPPTAP